jgi:hypothetical protein
MRIGFVSAIAGLPTTTLDEIVAEVSDVEAEGFAFYSVPAIFSLDAVSKATLRAGLARYRDAGVTDFAPSVFPGAAGAVERTRAFLRSEL